ncbi:hypothetical protein IV203_016347 [Nitzschia inconspicua]|uniref:PX domain-containing protein n=1 Tax=Nitzschia inconspicua TaxID=303405 RepID=A0A9K3KPU6_9STRA|nr:hypothetical protein IV203_016347 [Nitzschia inconspicua]
MLGAIQRVISGEKMDEEGQQQQQEQQSNNPPNSGTMSNTAFAIVENDEDDHDSAMDVEIPNTYSNDDDHTVGSSISDFSVAKDGEHENVVDLLVPSDHPMVVTEEWLSNNNPSPAPRNSERPVVSATPKASGRLSRSDSRNSGDSYSSYGRQSSQNSSRDWGWFEETEHGNTPNLSNNKLHRPPLNKEEEKFLLRQQKHHQAAAAKASVSNTGNDTSMDEDDFPSLKKGVKKKKKGKGTSVLAHLALTANDDLIIDETQQVLLDPPADLESEARAMAVTAPNYVLEESLSSQRLWKYTAGNRPPQPVEERAFFEKMWAQNFARSQVEYQMPVEVLTATTPISMSPFADGTFDTSKELSNYTMGAADGGNPLQAVAISGAPKQDAAEATLVSRLNDPARGTHTIVSGSSGQHHIYNHEVVNRKIKGNSSDEDLTVLIKGDNVFGTTVSKSFARPGVNGGPIAGVDTVNISIASYRVIESKKHGKYAQFLVIYREGSIRDTIGVWKRYSDFQRLSEKVTKAHEGCAAVIANMSPLAITEEHDVEHLPNAITSWRLLKKRQRWYRCLDAGYLSLKVFLLERFLHDILFESSTPDLLRDFVKGE